MKCIIGLGNNGDIYTCTRHNVGFWVLDEFVGYHGLEYAKRDHLLAHTIEHQGTLLVRPETFMNTSGNALRRILKEYQDIWAQNTMVIHDDVDLPIGQYKLSRGRGANRHNGIKSISNVFGTRGFWRMRVGVKSASYTNYQGTRKDFVLSKFSAQESGTIQQLIHDSILPDIDRWLGDKIR